MEKDKGCQQLIMKWFKDHCVFGDILQMIVNKPPEDRLMDPSEVKFKQKARCVRHQKDCQCVFPKDANAIGVLGAPCVLFSKILSFRISESHS